MNPPAGIELSIGAYEREMNDTHTDHCFPINARSRCSGWYVVLTRKNLYQKEDSAVQGAGKHCSLCAIDSGCFTSTVLKYWFPLQSTEWC
jgi:hypothetical protein